MLKIKRNSYNVIIIYILQYFCSMQISYALPSDNLENIIITSDKFEINYLSGHAVYKGNVELKQGSRKLNAHSLYVYFESNNQNTTKSTVDKAENLSHNLSIKEIEAIGEPATYQEQLKTKQNIIQAQALIMKFTPRINLVTLQDNAIIKQDGKILTSDLLHYNIKTEIAYSLNKKISVIN